MANRYFREFKRLSFEIAVKEVFAHITFGAAGAPTIDVTNSKGVASVVRNSAGNYTLTFGTPASTQAAVIDTYTKLLGLQKTSISTSAAPAAPSMYITSQAIKTAGTITIQFLNGATATDPASGEEVLLHAVFGDSNT